MTDADRAAVENAAERYALNRQLGVVWDGRYFGRHGIGRFAHEVYARLPDPPPSLNRMGSKPTSLLGSAAASVALRGRRARLLVSPGYAPALPGPYSQLLTLHDLIHLENEEEMSRAKRMFYEHLVLPAVRRAGAVMTVSEFSRDRIVNWTGLPPERVFNVGNGCSVDILDSAESTRVRQRPLRRPFILFVGNARPHKNFRLLAEALAFLPDEIGVVTVGLRPEYVRLACGEAGIEAERVLVKPTVDDGELTRLYSESACLAVPSTHEGFGLIALEAMARATPTAYICDAVREVVGDTGFRCSQEASPEEYAGCLARAIDGKLTAGSDLVARAREFRWSDVAGRVNQATTVMRGGVR